MTYSEGDKMISQAVAINKDDLAAFKKLDEMGVELEIRQLASSSAENLNAKLDSISFD